MSTSNPLGFAIVGTGMIARFHVRALADVPGTRLAALVTRDPAKMLPAVDNRAVQIKKGDRVA